MTSQRPSLMPTFYLSPHADDWIFFRGEQAYSDLATARVVLILTTAGDAGLASGYWEARERAALDAIAVASPTSTVMFASARIHGHAIPRYEFEAGSLYCLRLPDGRLEELRSSPLTTVDGSARYESEEDFSETLEAILRREQGLDDRPPWINAPLYRSDTAPAAGDIGFDPINPDDHPDHTATGRAIRRFASDLGHRAWWWGYSIAGRPCPIENPCDLAHKRSLFDGYKRSVYAQFEARGRPDDWVRWISGLDYEWSLWGPKSHFEGAFLGQPDPY